jgi:hypothetical protein
MRNILILLALAVTSSWCWGQDKTVNVKLLSLTAFNGTAVALDAYTTLNMNGHKCPREVWSPELYGTHPHAVRTSLVMGAEFALSSFLSYKLKKRHSRFWIIPAAFTGTEHLRGAIHNYEVCQ